MPCLPCSRNVAFTPHPRRVVYVQNQRPRLITDPSLSLLAHSLWPESFLHARSRLCHQLDFPHLPRERLQCPTAAATAAFEAAVRRGDIVWHAGDGF